MASCNLLWRHPFRLSLVTIGYHLFQTLIYFISLLTHKSSSRGCIINHLSVWSQSIVKEFDLQLSWKSTVWDFPDQALIPFLNFIDTFRFKLREGSEITSKFCRFWREKVLSKEFVRHFIPGHNDVLRQWIKPCLLLSFKEKEKSFSLTNSVDTPLILCVS